MTNARMNCARVMTGCGGMVIAIRVNPKALVDLADGDMLYSVSE